jgi:hypothetical protein
MGLLDVKNRKHFDFLETFTWEKFKLWLNRRFAPHHLVLKDDKAPRIQPRGRRRFFGHLCVRLQSDPDSGPFEGITCENVDLLAWSKALGVEDRLLEDGYPKHPPKLDENGGVYRGRRPSMPQGETRSRVTHKNQTNLNN